MFYDSNREPGIGFVTLPISEVISRAELALADLLAKREESRKAFISHFTQEPTGWRKWLGRKAWTEEEAIKHINEDMWLGYEYYYMTPEYQSPKKTKLEQLIKVGNGMLEDNVYVKEMTVSIEMANMLYSCNM